MKQDKAWFALRRTLVPWRFNELLIELSDKVNSYAIDEVILKIDTEEFSHGHYPLEEAKKIIPELKRVKEYLNKKGVLLSINPWSTLGHADRANDATTVIPGIELMVGSDGTTSKHCACPLSQEWLSYITELYSIYAEVEPHVLWVEDDLRNFNHNPVEFGCFCNNHLKELEKRTGTYYDRESLVTQILHADSPSNVRESFLKMQGDITNKIFESISNSISKISKNIGIGLMSSGPFVHVLEGRNWSGLYQAKGSLPLFSRPPLGNYSENSLRGLYYSLHSIKATRQMFPNEVIEMTEVENIPFTQYSKSNTLTFLQMVITFAMGCDGATLNLYDHRGSYMSEDPSIGIMLAKSKPFLNALKKVSSSKGHYRGIQRLFSEDYSMKKILSPGANYYDLMVTDEVSANMLEPLGIPTTYNKSTVKIVTGQMIRCISDQTVMELLSESILLDSVAVGILIERGFGHLTGVKSVSKPKSVYSLKASAAEEFFNEDFGGKKDCFLTPFLPDYGQTPKVSELQLDPTSTVVSHFVDADRVSGDPVLSVFENSLGGRVATYAYNLSKAVGTGFFHEYRRIQIQSIIEWLGYGKTAAVVRNMVYPLFISKDIDNYTVCTLMNLSLDEAGNTVIELNDKREVSYIQWLLPNGKWTKKLTDKLSISSVGDRHSIKILNEISFRQPVSVTIHWK